MKENNEVSDAMIDELYGFIVGSNLEHAFVRCCENPELKRAFAKWFQIEEVEMF